MARRDPRAAGCHCTLGAGPSFLVDLSYKSLGVSETDMTKALSRFFLIVILAGSMSAQIVIRPDIDVNPTFGSPAGGDRIRITFLGSATNTCATGLICTPIVTFDGLPATVAENNTGSIVVVTPPHPRGDVKISIDVD